jgi:undecaprenyl diphosphate synthase
LKSGVKIKVLGDLSLFPDDVREKFKSLVDKTKNNNSYFLNIALVMVVVKKFLAQLKNIALMLNNGVLSPEILMNLFLKIILYLVLTPDLIIRTGGDFRTSNFLPWQSIYSEWFFLIRNGLNLAKKI